MAPEILNNKPYGDKIDIYSFGVSLYEALIGTVPFTGIDKEDLRKNVNKGIIRLPIDINLTSCCLHFLSKCLKIDP